jgi:hypothetical protein
VASVFAHPILAVALLCIILDALVNYALPLFEHKADFKKLEDRVSALEKKALRL